LSTILKLWWFYFCFFNHLLSYKDHAVKNTIRKKFMKNRPLLNNMNKNRKLRNASDTGNDHVAVDVDENDQKTQAKKRKFIKPNLDD
jgi:hypothetical protein